MPAVDLSRLRVQAARLAEHFGQPADFLHALHELLDLYADRTLRPGRLVSPVTVLPSYRTPEPVIRQVEANFRPHSDEHPEEMLRLADALWQDGHLETRLLAAGLLGCLPPDHGLIERLDGWSREIREPHVRRSLLTASMQRLRRERTTEFLRLIATWLNPGSDALWSNAIQALLPLLAEQGFNHMPTIFRIARPVIEAGRPMLQNDCAQLINALHAVSPVETGYYLKQLITLSPQPQTVITLRRLLPGLAQPLQENLKDLLRSAPK